MRLLNAKESERQTGKIRKKSILNPCRVRKTNGVFSFISHEFLTQGFYGCLSNEVKNLYMFLVLASDKNGLSYYSDKRIYAYAGLNIEIYNQARDSLIEKNLIEYNGRIFQVLELPVKGRTIIFFYRIILYNYLISLYDPINLKGII